VSSTAKPQKKRERDSYESQSVETMEFSQEDDNLEIQSVKEKPKRRSSGGNSMDIPPVFTTFVEQGDNDYALQNEKFKWEKELAEKRMQLDARVSEAKIRKYTEQSIEVKDLRDGLAAANKNIAGVQQGVDEIKALVLILAREKQS
jgi:hypothetical protein